MLMQNIVGLVLVYAIIVASLGLSLLAERRGADDNIVRKIVHVGVGFFVFVWWVFTENWIMAVFFTVPFAVILFLAMFKGNAVNSSKIGELSTEKGHRWGLFLYVVTINIMVFFFFDHWTAASIGIAAMTFGDAFGSIIGRRFGRHSILNGKSLEGSLAVFAATVVMALVIMLFYGYLADAGLFSGSVSPSAGIFAAAVAAGAIA